MNELYTAAIIDDEESAREGLRSLINVNFPEIQIISESASLKTVIQTFPEVKPQLLFLNIKLFDRSDADIRAELTAVNLHLILVTSPDTLIDKSFKTDTLHYIIKPISLKVLELVIQKIKNHIEQSLEKERQENARLLLANTDKKLAIKEAGGTRFVKVSKIIRCQSESNYTHIHLVDGKSILSTRTLKEYSELLKNYGFFRIHQSHLINLSMVSRILKKDSLYVEMESGDLLNLSRKKKEGLMASINGIIRLG